MNKAAQAYFQTKVSTTDQGQLLLMLYDGALNFLQQARNKMLAKDYAAKGILISKVIDIVNELSSTLNMEKGGTLAENLNNLYFLCTARLLQANLKMNVEQLDSVAGILSGLRSAYAQILDTPEAQKAAAQIASKMKPDASMMQRAAPLTSPLTSPRPMPAAAGQAQAAYGQRNPAPVAEAPAAAQPPTARVTPMPFPAQAPAAHAAATRAPVTQASAAHPVAPHTPAPQAAASPAQHATTPPTSPAATPLTAPGLHKKLAAYGKI